MYVCIYIYIYIDTYIYIYIYTQVDVPIFRGGHSNGILPIDGGLRGGRKGEEQSKADQDKCAHGAKIA